MIFKNALIMLVVLASVSYGGFDDSFIWKYYMSRPDYIDKSFITNDDGIKSMFLHSNLYGIESLNWNFISMQYNKGAAGLGVEFSAVGYKKYYQRNKYRMRLEYRFHKNFNIAPLIEIRTEEFQNFGQYTGLSGELFVKYTQSKYDVGFGVAEIQMKDPYDKCRKETVNPFAFGSWIFNEGLTLSVGVRCFENRRTRWIFDQFVVVNNRLGLNFGYKNNPSNIYGGLDLTVKKFSFIITYSSISGLNDSVIWGISFRERSDAED